MKTTTRHFATALAVASLAFFLACGPPDGPPPDDAGNCPVGTVKADGACVPRTVKYDGGTHADLTPPTGPDLAMSCALPPGLATKTVWHNCRLTVAGQTGDPFDCVFEPQPRSDGSCAVYCTGAFSCPNGNVKMAGADFSCTDTVDRDGSSVFCPGPAQQL